MASGSECTEELGSPRANATAPMTPRRSARKSIKPQLDYSDIIEKKVLRSHARRAIENEQNKNSSPPQHKWTPSEVGRASSSRRKKSKRISAKNCTEDVLDLVSVEVKDSAEIHPEVPTKIEIDDSSKDQTDQTVNEAIGNIDSSKDQTDQAVNEAIGKKSTDYELNERNEKSSVDCEMNEVEREKKCENENESFGAYLKSNTIDISDLGLEPLENEENNDIMPSLLVCEDENQKEVLNTTWETSVERSQAELVLTGLEKENKDILNSTFDAEDSKVLSTQPDVDPLPEGSHEKPTNIKKGQSLLIANEDVVMQSLLISDDEDENTGNMNSEKNELNSEQVKVSTSLHPTFKFVLTDENQEKSTLFHCDMPQPGTPKVNSGKKYRQPTPYKAKLNKNFLKDEIQNSSTFTTLEPREIAYRSIRKRSNSLSINTPATRCVSFYSPANQILGIDDVDKLMAASVKKLTKSQKETIFDRNVTKRRKRSISLDDKNLRISRIPKPTATMIPLAKRNAVVDKQQPKKVTPKSIQKGRTKLPNFAAIHQKHFNQMENLVQHVERKAERAKILTNSNTKPRNASAQKKPIVKSDTASRTPNKKLELLFQVEPNIELPKPRQILKKPLTNLKYVQPKQVDTSKVQQTLKEPNRLISAVSRPQFTLSTQTTTSSVSSNNARNYAEKAAQRRQRHMDMFKGRTTAKRVESGDSHQRADFIRGVRSNRRFELQMQHRKNIEER